MPKAFEMLFGMPLKLRKDANERLETERFNRSRYLNDRTLVPLCSIELSVNPVSRLDIMPFENYEYGRATRTGVGISVELVL